jgi:hypothetical protein
LTTTGDKPNEELLFQSGFALENNVHDNVTMMSPLATFMQEDPLLPAKVHILKEVLSPFLSFHSKRFLSKGGVRVPRLFLTRSGFTAASVAMGRLCVLDEQDMSMLYERYQQLAVAFISCAKHNLVCF